MRKRARWRRERLRAGGGAARLPNPTLTRGQSGWNVGTFFIIIEPNRLRGRYGGAARSARAARAARRPPPARCSSFSKYRRCPIFPRPCRNGGTILKSVLQSPVIPRNSEERPRPRAIALRNGTGAGFISAGRPAIWSCAESAAAECSAHRPQLYLCSAMRGLTLTPSAAPLVHLSLYYTTVAY
ncbi:hypothetical protein EVAR_32321_1 [Eumeta japonica]|uniref:Uncharacterized protein n=1 Tax=Eumeta variegata TaxID=151549 RepID=A0A4C1ZDN1_EUMVA|nr:hypothetical protein EVAR_32321_1 [Eumeta japonica]